MKTETYKQTPPLYKTLVFSSIYFYLIADGRFKKKKKWGILFPLFVIIKLIKLEALLGLVFLLLVIVKKTVFIGGLILFKAIKSLKSTCIALQTAPHHHYYVREADGNILTETHELAEEEDEEAHEGVWDSLIRHWHNKKKHS